MSIHIQFLSHIYYFFSYKNIFGQLDKSNFGVTRGIHRPLQLYMNIRMKLQIFILIYIKLKHCIAK
jgi:hypothetical protein